MAISEATPVAAGQPVSSIVWRLAYRIVSYFAIVSVFGALLYGFRYDAAASPWNYAYNLALYAVFAIPHLVMTRAWFKRQVWGIAEGSPRERRVYILTTTVMWGLILLLHRPVPGFEYQLPELVRFLGTLGFLLSVLLFYEGFTFAKLDSLLGAPGTAIAYSHGPETPLFTDGQYAQVRHPMYRAALCAGFCTVLIHCNAGELFWAILIGATFLAFIPIEEAQLIAARGQEYQRYMATTRYRIVQGIW